MAATGSSRICLVADVGEPGRGHIGDDGNYMGEGRGGSTGRTSNRVDRENASCAIALNKSQDVNVEEETPESAHARERSGTKG